MNTSNIPARSIRHSEVGLVWIEMLSGAMGTLSLQPYTTIRVRATGATTVTIDGVLAATMVSGEIFVMNVGNGSIPGNPGPPAQIKVSVVIGGANAFVQVGQQVERQGLNANLGNQVVEGGESP